MLKLLTCESWRSESRVIAVMVGWIALIHFVVEGLIMGTLAGWQLDRHVIAEGLLDCTLLTVFSSPLIYYFVARPFIEATNAAEARLKRELDLRTEQAEKLESARVKLESSLDLNEELREHLQQSNEKIAEINELTLQRIGADLHDGPAQLLTYSLLRLGKLSPAVQARGKSRALNEFEGMQSALSDSLTEVRNISRGLSLPQLDSATLADVIDLSVMLHQEVTGTTVSTSIGELSAEVTKAVKTCVYRVVQESLSNAYKHAGAKDQKVTARMDKQLVLVMSDGGPGFSIEAAHRRGLGLTGMRARVEALGGSMSIDSGNGRGTVLTVRLDVSKTGSRGGQDG